MNDDVLPWGNILREGGWLNDTEDEPLLTCIDRQEEYKFVKTGDIALIKSTRVQDDPFKLLSIESVTISGKVVAVHYPSFTVKFDKPTPEGYEYRDCHVNDIANKSISIQDGNLNTVLSVISDIVSHAKKNIDPSSSEKMSALPLTLLNALMCIERICEEYAEETTR